MENPLFTWERTVCRNNCYLNQPLAGRSDLGKNRYLYFLVKDMYTKTRTVIWDCLGGKMMPWENENLLSGFDLEKKRYNFLVEDLLGENPLSGINLGHSGTFLKKTRYLHLGKKR